jgi:signal transduction histidine kinase
MADPAPITVLIAEDEPAVRDALADLIHTDHDLKLVGAAGDAEAAIELARRHHPNVALLDVKMPGGGGPRASRAIRSLSPETRVVALSAYEDRATVLEMLRAGAAGYLVKGASAGEIVEAIRRSVRGQASLSTEVTAEVIYELVDLLDRSERMARRLQNLDRTKTELIQVLSHELMTPITVIQGAAGTISGVGRNLSQADADGLADSVARAAERLRRLVGNLAATARLDREDADLASRPMPVRDLILAATSSFPQHHDRLRFEDGEESEREVWADPALAGQALVAVLENALEHSPDNQAVEVGVAGSDGEVRITVADRGPGIPEDMREQVFEAFTQTDAGTTRTREGLGIGLYLTGKIMAAHGGRVEYAPREDGGSVFTLVFPSASGGPVR